MGGVRCVFVRWGMIGGIKGRGGGRDKERGRGSKTMKGEERKERIVYVNTGL